MLDLLVTDLSTLRKLLCTLQEQASYVQDPGTELSASSRVRGVFCGLSIVGRQPSSHFFSKQSSCHRSSSAGFLKGGVSKREWRRWGPTAGTTSFVVQHLQLPTGQKSPGVWHRGCSSLSWFHLSILRFSAGSVAPTCPF